MQLNNLKKRNIDTTDLEDIVTTILQLTPTSFGLQAYKFLVIKDEETRSALKEHSWGQWQVTDADMYVVFTVPTNFDASHIKRHMDNMQKN